MAFTEAISLMQAWWAAPIGRATRLAPGSNFPLGMTRFSPLAFASHGITPLGYAAFAFALGVTTGAVIRRTLPAMALTLAIFAAAAIAMPLGIRPYLFPPHHTTAAISTVNANFTVGSDFVVTAGSVPGQPGAWILSSGAVNTAGQPVTTPPAACFPPGRRTSRPSPPGPCLDSHGIRVAITYQPASRYWPLQWTETAIYLALALALTGYCFRRLGRRKS